MKRLKDLPFLTLFALLFIGVRTLLYKNLFMFINDQVTSSTRAMEIWRAGELTLIGPPMSLTVEHRQIFFGGICYYTQLFFLLLGRFDPFWSTYIFMIFSALMIFPLYIGTKKLINYSAGLMMVILYTLLPFYIEGTSTLYNPFFQFALLPVLIYLIGLFKEKKRTWLIFLIGLLSGVLLQFHYQFVIVLIGLVLYYLRIVKITLKQFVVMATGLVIGFSPIILFELKHQFYITQTIFLFLTHPNQLRQGFSDYYVLSISFFVILLLLGIFKKHLTKLSVLMVFGISLIVALYHVTLSTNGRQQPSNWSYKDELAAFSIIKDNYYNHGLRNFNIFEFYTSNGSTQKYFMKKEEMHIKYDDYYTNKYLYVIYPNNRYMNDVAYEVHGFQPNKVVKSWKLNNFYTLYLLERQ